MPNVATHEVPAALFAWDKNHGIAAMSDLPKLPERVTLVGYTRRVEFVYVGANKNQEGEVTACCFLSTCGRYRLTVFND